MPKNKCLACRVENAQKEYIKKHPSDTALRALLYMQTPKAKKNSVPCERHGGKNER